MSDGSVYDPSGAMVHLITHFRSRGVTAEHLERMHPAVRTHYAKMAGLNVPTEEGWDALIDKMRRGTDAPSGDLPQMQDPSALP
jgi:hypothetical protein